MIKTALLSVSAGTLLFVAVSLAPRAQPAPEPWREPQDTFASAFDSDRYAWRLFIALNWPANVATKTPDAGKAFGADGPVVWETWRSVKAEAPDTVFPSNGSDPGAWLGVAGPVASQEQQRFDRQLETQRTLTALNQRRATKPQPVPAFDGGLGSEIRLNMSTYDFIRSKKLFNKAGQVAHLTAGETNLNFPPNAKLIKATWRTIDPSDKPRFHWADVTRTNGTKEVWGLVALHIITKDLPNWFWTTFEHIDNKSQSPGWDIPSVDRIACSASPYNCDQAPTGLGLEGTKWMNYRLRGTQVDFITPSGEPTRLSNSLIEIKQDSSCITCHARATINADGRSFGSDPSFGKGSPQREWFFEGNRRVYMQQDFVFSLERASAESP